MTRVLKLSILHFWEAKKMLRIFYADLRSMIRNKGFLSCIGGMVMYVAGFTVLLTIILKGFMGGGMLVAEEIMGTYSDVAVLFIAATVLMAFNIDYSDGIIRNKMICGVKRSGIAVSVVSCGCIAGVALCITSVVSSCIMSLFFSTGLSTLTVTEAVDSILVLTLASMAVGAFSTFLMVLFGGTKGTYVSGLLIAFIFKLIGMEVAEKLYPEQGECLLTGTKLMLYRFYDRFVPYAHFSFYRRWAFTDYLIGSIACIIISYVLSVLVMNKKEIK